MALPSRIHSTLRRSYNRVLPTPVHCAYPCISLSLHACSLLPGSPLQLLAPKLRSLRTMDALSTRCVNTVRVLSADVVERANSGHPGAPMGCAPIAHVLFSRVMRYDAKDPKWVRARPHLRVSARVLARRTLNAPPSALAQFNRDRFVLSNGHASALLYSMLHLSGYDMPMEQLQVRATGDGHAP